MTGATQIGTTLLLPQGAGGADLLADLNWQIKAVGDFTGDDKPDLLWQNDANGQLAVWSFDNATRTNTTYLTLLSGQLGDPDVTWKVVGAADMNGDGHLDLVWWNASTTAMRIWHMDGIVQLNSAALSVTTNDPQWQVVGVADMNGDHWPDLIWRHDGNGGLATWFMYDTTRLDTQWLSPDLNSDVQWRVVGVVDMNTDGKPDLVWQHVGNGQLGVWYMNGTTQTGTSYLTPSTVSDINWRIVGVR